MSSLRNNYSAVSNSDYGFVLRAMTDTGEPDGDPDLTVNGSITPVERIVKPGVNDIFILNQLSITLSDKGNPAITDYGGITGPLTNGVQFYFINDGIETPFGLPLKTNQQLAELGARNISSIDFAASVTLVTYTFNITEFAQTSTILLHGDHGDEFGVRIQDNLTGLTTHSALVAGRWLLRNI